MLQSTDKVIDFHTKTKEVNYKKGHSTGGGSGGSESGGPNVFVKFQN